MKTKAIIGLFLCTVGMGYAAVVNVVTTGHANEYTDGTAVPAGERVVSVIVPAGESFGGFYEDGTLVSENDAFHGQNMQVNYDEEDTCLIAANTPPTNQGDSLYFFIQDTRGGGVSAYGCIGWCTIPGKYTKTARFIPAYDPDLGYVVVNTPTVKKGGEAVAIPVLTGIVLDEAQGVVRLSVTNTVESMTYEVLSTTDLREVFTPEVDAASGTGKADPLETLELVVPLRASDSARFYKVRGESL